MFNHHKLSLWNRLPILYSRVRPRPRLPGPRQCFSTWSKSCHLFRTASVNILDGKCVRPMQSFLSARCCSSTSRVTASTEDGVEGEEAFSELDLEHDSEFSTVVGGEDDGQHFRINLYPDSKDPVLTSLCEASSVAQVFGIIQGIDPDSRNEKHSSQALVSIWDLQKYLYKVGAIFDPDRDFTNRYNFVEHLSKHSSFNEVCEDLVTQAHLLQDEPLAASLLCLKRMSWSMKSPECQVFIQESLNRKSTLALPALSRLCVCMRTEGLYGSLVMTYFLPRIQELVQSMDDDLSVRLLSICLRNMNRALPPSMVQLYRKKLSSVLPTIQFESVTFCKIILCLLDTRHTAPENDELTPQHLLRQVGNMAVPQVPEMDLMEILSLQRFLEHGSHEPIQFLDAIHSRISRFIEEQKDMPRLDLLACISPFIRRSLEQKRRLATHVQEYLETYENFDQVSQILLKIMRVLKLNDKGLYDKYWRRATQLLSMESLNTRTSLRLANDYLNFTSGLSYCYRHEDFEVKAKNLLYFYLANYRNQTQPCLIAPGDFAKIYAFLIAFGSPNDPIFLEQSYGFLNAFDTHFANQSHLLELGTLARGVAASLFFNANNNSRTSRKYFDQIMDFCSVLEETASYKLLGEHGEELSPPELISICKLHLTIKRAFGDSPIFQESISRWAEACSPQMLDSKLGREVALTLIAANYNAPPVLELIKSFILENAESVNADMVSKFLCLAYSLGYEPEDTADPSKDVFRICYEILERNWEQLGALTLLQAALALVYFRTMEPPLLHQIFSAQFLDEVDQELSSCMVNSQFPLKVRNTFMELNRAVCLDLPSGNIPWFHQKFCEGMVQASNPLENYFQTEVSSILTELLSGSSAIQKNVHSPYFYPINFLVEFDKDKKPIKIPKPSRLLALPKLRLPSSSEPGVEVSERVAISILPKLAFTKNQRSLKGFYKLRTRHLEMLGYRVVLIDPQHWNSMFMSEPYAKHNFLESSIFSKPVNAVSSTA